MSLLEKIQNSGNDPEAAAALAKTFDGWNIQNFDGTDSFVILITTLATMWSARRDQKRTAFVLLLANAFYIAFGGVPSR